VTLIDPTALAAGQVQVPTDQAAHAPVAAPDPVAAALASQGTKLDALIAILTAQAQAPHPAAQAAPDPSAPPAPAHVKRGDLVEWTYEDHLDGPTSRFGIVASVLEDGVSQPRATVAWFAGLSGPMLTAELTLS
jgi:hypothetical protein